VGVVGAGAWGTALAALAARAGRRVTLWAHEREVAEAIAQRRENPAFLAGAALPEGVRATAEFQDLEETEALMIVAPAQFLRAVLTDLVAVLGDARPLALCAKGLERDTGKLMSQVARETAPAAPVAVLSGPSFAADVARGLPTAVTLAADDAAVGGRWIATLGGPRFRPYLSDDVLGAELGGAVKNVLAIACGVVEGRGLGESARAALIARGFAELQRLAAAMGARPQTLGGLAGLGDLILTCGSRQSRNMSLGVALGEPAWWTSWRAAPSRPR